MEPKSHKRRNIIILLVIIFILILVLARGKNSNLNPSRLTEEQKAQILAEINRQAQENPGATFSDSQKEAIVKEIQTDNSSSVTLTEEQKAALIKDLNKN